MNISVSKIKNRALRRAAIAVSYPVLAVLGFPVLLVVQVLPLFILRMALDYIGWQATLGQSALREWRK